MPIHFPKVKFSQHSCWKVWENCYSQLLLPATFVMISHFLYYTQLFHLLNSQIQNHFLLLQSHFSPLGWSLKLGDRLSACVTPFFTSQHYLNHTKICVLPTVSFPHTPSNTLQMSKEYFSSFTGPWMVIHCSIYHSQTTHCTSTTLTAITNQTKYHMLP